MQTIAITGASGYIGKHLLAELLNIGGYEVRVLSRNKQKDLAENKFDPRVEIIEGELNDPAALQLLLKPGCTIVNLVYLWEAGEAKNLEVTRQLLAACKAAKVARLIHCSTAAVAGRAPDNLIDENTLCQPVTEYGTTKLMIEHEITNSAKDHFDSVILRPTSVFGINGEPLKKLAKDLSLSPRWKNYLKSCIFGKRRMNLVHIVNVVAAIVFLIRYKQAISGGVFIVSDDDEVTNNFKDVEDLLLDELGERKYVLPRLPLPLSVLKLVLLTLGRNNVNPSCNFASNKLRSLGFKPVISLHEGLIEYASWYRAKYILENGRKVQ